MIEVLISVIVPVYNAEKYVEECIKSVIGQTYQKWELLLIDDGSSDASGEIIDEFAGKDERIKVFHKENGGTHTARNKGLELACGDYVMFMDPDDWLDTDILECLAEKIEEYDLDVIRFTFIKEFADTHVKKQNTFLKDTLYKGEECRELLRQTVGLTGDELKHPENLNFLASVCFNAYRKKIIVDNKIEFFNIRAIGTFSDGLFNIELFKHVKSFLFVDRGFYHYRKTNTHSATSNYREGFPDKQGLLFEKIESVLKDCFTGDIEMAYYNRIAIGTMELCLNALKSKKDFKEKYREIKAVLNDELHKKAISRLDIKLLPVKWKIYFVFIKLRITILVYLMTYAIRMLMNRGK